MAVFGAPTAFGDDAERAVRAALAVRDAVASDDLQLRMARALLNHASGRDFAGSVADAEFVLEASAGNPDRVGLVSVAARTLCITAQLSGDYEQAQRASLRALADIERYGDDNDFAILLDSLAMEHHTATRLDEFEFIVDRSIKQAIATQAPVALILSPLLTGGKVFDK